MPEPTHTPFAGLISIPPGASLAANGFELQFLDPVIVDRLLRLGARDHKHDGAAALATPVAGPLASRKATGGSIPGGETVTIAYTLVDDDGGETLPSPNKAVVMPGSTAPGKAPTLTPSFAAGSLTAHTYNYGVSVTDGAGGESVISPLATYTLEGGHANAEITVSGLKEILEETGGVEWRLWRNIGGGQWAKIAQGTTASKLDNGTLVEDCTVAPLEVSTIEGTNSLEVEVPEHSEARARFVRLYATTTGTFGSSALLDEYPVAESGELKTYTALNLSTGQPPSVTRAYSRPAKIDAATEILGGGGGVGKIATLAALEEITPEENGELWVVTEEIPSLYVSQGGKWRRIGKLTEMPIGYAIPGTVPTGVQPGMYVPRGAEYARVLGVYGSIASGTSITYKLTRNGVVIPGYNEQVVTKAKYEHFESVGINPGDLIAINIVTNIGTAKDLSLTPQIGWF